MTFPKQPWENLKKNAELISFDRERNHALEKKNCPPTTDMPPKKKSKRNISGLRNQKTTIPVIDDS
jgi:hypothetical protein